MYAVKQGNIFEQPVVVPTVRVHAVNCEGVMGAGVAVLFRKNYKKGYHEYRRYCLEAAHSMVGEATVHDADFDGDLSKMGCLYTSELKSSKRDPVAEIVKATALAIPKLLHQCVQKKITEIHSVKINAGLFGVPWELSEAIIQASLGNHPINWTVWEYTPHPSEYHFELEYQSRPRGR
jgi:ADP-ribose 1''-phosphate phosphatase